MTMTNGEQIAQAVEAKNKGNYNQADRQFHALNQSFRDKQPFTFDDAMCLTVENLKFSYIKGDFVEASMFHGVASKMLSTVEAPELHQILEDYGNHVKASLECDKNRELYPYYRQFRSRIDPFYREKGDFDVFFGNYFGNFLQMQLFKPKEVRSTQQNNHEYFIEVLGDDMCIEFLYERPHFVLGQRKVQGQLRLQKFLIPQGKEEKILAILTFLHKYASRQEELFLVTKILEEKWFESLKSLGATELRPWNQEAGGAVQFLKEPVLSKKEP